MEPKGYDASGEPVTGYQPARRIACRGPAAPMTVRLRQPKAMLYNLLHRPGLDIRTHMTTHAPQPKPTTWLFDAAYDLYFAGMWICPDLPAARQHALWLAFGDAMALDEQAYSRSLSDPGFAWRERAAARSATNLPRLAQAANDLYFAGSWTCPGLYAEKQNRLWTAMRDGLGHEPGAWHRFIAEQGSATAGSRARP